MQPIVVTMLDGSPYSINQPLLTKETRNAKFAKSAGGDWVIYGLSFAPAKLSGHQVCPSSTPGCRNACIFTSGNGGYPRVRKGRLARTRAWFQKRGEFKERLLHEIGNAVKLGVKRGKQVAVRLNVFSDLMWEKLFPELFDKFPQVQLYDYTKHYERMMKFIRGDFPPNYYLTFSRSEKNEAECLEVLKAGRNVSVPFTLNKVMHPELSVPMPKNFLGYQVVNGEENDLRFLDPQGVVMGIKTKGMGFWDKTDFIVDIYSQQKEQHALA